MSFAREIRGSRVPNDTFLPGTTICRAGSGDSCDPNELCTGVADAACPGDVVSPAATICNPGSADQCDPDETCTGTPLEACPADTFLPGTTICRAGSGDLCDPNELCPGAADAACPADIVSSTATICNPGSGDLCDLHETCTGTPGAACPADTIASTATICRPGSGDVCDPAESCTGVADATCPADIVSPAATVCNPGSGDLCDPEELCTGTPGAACPADTIASTATICRPGSGDVCDPAESCTGVADATCPADIVSPAATVCNPGSGDQCDPEELCTGTPGAACPADTIASTATICRPGSGDVCDPAESCTGVADAACPADIVSPAATICNPGSGDLCDPDELCTGTPGAACPADTIASAATICRPGSGDVCNPAESCTGVADAACPADVVATAGVCADAGELAFTLVKSRELSQPLCPGSNIIYSARLTYTPQQRGTLNYTLEDLIPPGTSLVGGILGGGTFDSALDKIIWTGSLEPGETVSVRFLPVVDAVPDQTLIVNQASAILFDPQVGDSKTGQAQVQDRVDCPALMMPRPWTGGGGDNDFSNPNNWDPPVVPGPDDDVVIPPNSGRIIVSQSHEIRSLNLGANSVLQIEGGSLTWTQASTVDGLLLNGSGEPASAAVDAQSTVVAGLIIQRDVSGDGIIRNHAQMSVTSASIDVELETDGHVEINGQVSLTKPSENQGSYSLDSGAILHYQGDGHNLGMTLNGPTSSTSDAVIFLQQATTATVQIDSSASAEVTGPVEVRGNVDIVISGNPSASSISIPLTGSSESGAVGWSGGNVDLGSGSSLRNEGTMTLSEPEDGSPTMIVQDGAEFTNAGAVGWNGGTIRLEGSAQLVNEASGAFAGAGIIEGSVINSGVFEVGSPIGTTTVTGKYTQLATGELRMELAGAGSFDILRVGTETMESASLDGILSVASIDGFTPATGDSSLILDGSTEGSFSNCLPLEMSCTGLPSLDAGLLWEVINGVSVTLRVVPEDLEPVSPLYFAQFGDGEIVSTAVADELGASSIQLSSEIFLLNTDKTMEARATIAIKGDDGQPLSDIDLNGIGLVQGTVDVTIPACGLRILRTDGQGLLQSGSATVTSEKQLSGVVVFNSGIGAAGVGASAALPEFIAPIVKTAEINTGIAFQNPGSDQVTVNLELRNPDGDLLASASIILAGMGHQSFLVDEIGWIPEPDVSLDLTDFEGLVKATTSAGDLAATVVQTRPQEFVTMPVAAPSEVGSLELLFAQFGDGEQSGGGVSSEIILLNLSKTMSANATIVLRDDDGVPLSGADLDGQVLVEGSHDVTIPACGMRILRTDGEGPLQAGSATVTSDKPLAGVIVFNSSAGAAGVGSSDKLSGFAAPMLRNAATNTGISVQNPGSDQVTVDLQLRSSDGVLLATASITLAGMGHRALFVDEITWTPEPGVSKYSVNPSLRRPHQI